MLHKIRQHIHPYPTSRNHYLQRKESTGLELALALVVELVGLLRPMLMSQRS